MSVLFLLSKSVLKMPCLVLRSRWKAIDLLSHHLIISKHSDLSYWTEEHIVELFRDTFQCAQMGFRPAWSQQGVSIQEAHVTVSHPFCSHD